jgi:hypothetical protein
MRDACLRHVFVCLGIADILGFEAWVCATLIGFRGARDGGQESDVRCRGLVRC